MNHAKNAAISLALMFLTNSIVNFVFNRDPVIVCREGVNDFGWFEYKARRVYPPQSVELTSEFIEMSDGVKLAADVYYSSKASLYQDKLPTIVQLSRYGRSYKLDFPFTYLAQFGDSINPRTTDYVNRFSTLGYAWVVVDVRGHGASYGTKQPEFSEKDLSDSKEILEWITKQSWSNGQVSGFATGFDGMGVVGMASLGHQAFSSLVINGAPVETYSDAFYPGGVLNKKAVEMYNAFTSAINSGLRWTGIPLLKPRLIMNTFGGDINPVNGDVKALKQALVDHKDNVDLMEELEGFVQYRDDKTKSGIVFEQMDIATRIDRLAKLQVPVYLFSGYFDMASARGAIKMFQKLSEDSGSRLTLGPWDHAGVNNANPHADSKTRCFKHESEITRFLDYHMRPEVRAFTELENEAPIHYFTMVEKKWRSTVSWPPAYVSDTTFLMSAYKKLIPGDIEIDFEHQEVEMDISYNHSTLNGRVSRWSMVDHVFTNRPLYYIDREMMTKDLIRFQTDRLPAMEITGEAELRVYFSVNAPDVVLFAYLEDLDVFPTRDPKRRDGSTYITEAVLRPVNRPIHPGSSERTFTRQDAKPLEVGEIHEAVFKFLPVSYYFKRGHQLRLTLSCSGDGAFGLSGEELASKIQIHFGSDYPSSLKLSRYDIPFPASPAPAPEAVAAPEEKEEIKDEALSRLYGLLLC